MAKQKVLAQKFGAVNKSRVWGRVGHSRTGACPSANGRCQCPKRQRQKGVGWK